MNYTSIHYYGHLEKIQKVVEGLIEKVAHELDGKNPSSVEAR